MAANTGERTLITALIPPGAAHIDGLVTVGSAEQRDHLTVAVAAYLSSLLSDSLVRAAPMANIRISSIERLPFIDSGLISALLIRQLRLQCLSEAYAGLWSNVFEDGFANDRWAGGSERPDRPALGEVSGDWDAAIPLRRAVDRRQAQIEIDALVALSLGTTASELATIYRTQFPVLYCYDHDDYLWDANGRLVPTEVRQAWKRAGEPTEPGALAADVRTVTHPGSDVNYTYELPFRLLDRERDLQTAYEEFERRYAKSA
jgi:hypothetical protein